MKRSRSSTNNNHQQSMTATKKEEGDDEPNSSSSWVSQLLTLLFSANELHVPSTKTTHYRNKITYNLPLSSSSNLSPLADVQLNEVCQSINDWATQQKSFPFREVMAKCSRDGSIMIRLTVQKRKQSACLNNGDTTICQTYTETYSQQADDDDNWNSETIKEFTSHVTSVHPNIKCICYNETYTKSRPTKDTPLHLIHGSNLHLLERTQSERRLEYQISVDSFCEVNFEVEDLQYEQTVKWIQEYQDAILIVSGRDINSFGLGFGSIQNNNSRGQRQPKKRVFSEVIAVQHCPLVAKDAVVNFTRHANEIKSTVLHLTKDDMARGVSAALDAALERQNYPPVVVVTTGGRKGLNESYLNFLTNHKSVECIVYNSCSMKSLVVDMEGFISGGFYIDDFKSYDFFAGTKHSASVLRLLRRPKTLVLPIGPAGSGKSTLASTLVRKCPHNMCLWWQRDLEFMKLRNGNVGMNKSKSILHDEMLSFLKGDGGSSAVRILDSTNGNREARALYLKEAKPGLLIVVVLSCSTKTTTHNDVAEILLTRTSDRLEGGKSSHPSFPTTVHEQREKHLAILKGIEYPSVDEVDAFKRECGRTFILEYDISDLSKLSSLPFEIFLRLSVSDHLRTFCQR